MAVFWKRDSLKKLHEKQHIEKQREEMITALENALCEIDTANAERIAVIEDALCDIDMGGNV